MVLRETPDFSASAAGLPLIIAQHPANPVGRTTVISFDTQLCRVICAVGFFYDLNEKFQAAFAGKVRKYYSITEKGSRELAAKQEEWNTYSRAVTTVLYQGV